MKHLGSGHHRDLKIVSVIERCLLHRDYSQIGLFCFNLTILQRKVGWPCATGFSITVSMSLSLPRCAVGIVATGKRLNHWSEYGLEISTSFTFMYLRKSLNWQKKLKKKKKYQRKLKQNCKHYPKFKHCKKYLQEMSQIACYWACPL